MCSRGNIVNNIVNKFVWSQMVARLIVGIILQCAEMLNLYLIHLKII